MRLLFLCNTLYQIIAASCVREMYSSDEAELILSDHSTGNKKIFESFKKTGLVFNKVYYLETKYLYEHDESSSRDELNKQYKSLDTINNMLKLNDNYDMFFCANAEPFSTRVVNYLKNKNTKVQINWFEDGLSAYNFDKNYFPSWKGYIKSWMKGLLGLYGVTSSVENYYVFQPDKMEWKPRASVKRISTMSDKLSKELGIIFDYKNCVDKYEEKYIFFEDGAMDWDSNADVEIVKEIADIVGKENIMIKIHPRNPVNRFKKLGFKTIEDTSIPWEIIATNIDIKNKILLTMYSQSIITPEILMGVKAKAISFGFLNTAKDKSLNQLFDYICRQYLNKDTSRYYVPKTKEELIEIVKKLNAE